MTDLAPSIANNADLDALKTALAKGYQGEFRYERPWGFERGIIVGDRTEAITTTDGRNISVPENTDDPTWIAIAILLNVAPQLIEELAAARTVIEAVLTDDGWCDFCGKDGLGHNPDCPLGAYLDLRAKQERGSEG